MQILKLEKAQVRFLELEELLADPKIIADQNQYQKLAKEYSDLSPLVQAFREFKKNEEQTQDLKEMLSSKNESDFEELARLELIDLQSKQEILRAQIEDLFNPKKQVKEHAMIIEIRAGTGGEEASLFAGDLYRMYCRYADNKGWKVELMSSSVSDTKGFKEVVFSVSGKEAEARLKWESGAHRVQRVPSTEASGRIHTSAATVAVMQEPEEVDIQINPSDLKIDVYRSSGPGGQSVNTTDSAVRITHLPTGVIVACQDERSQLKNRGKAMRVLRARLHDYQEQENIKKASQSRKAQIGTGDRSEKIRTYNFPDHRVTDHRVGFTTHQLHAVLDGEMDELTDALIKAEKESETASS